MGWQDLLQRQEERLVLPWTGGREVRSTDRTFRLEGRLPAEPGWYEFSVSGKNLRQKSAGVPAAELPIQATGYLVGDRLVADSVSALGDSAKLLAESERVWLVEDGLDRFSRVRAGRVYAGGPLLYIGQEMPLGPEEDVRAAFQDRKTSTDGIGGVVPALDAAFHVETWHRAETERRRAEVDAERRRAEAVAVAEAKRRELVEKLGDGAGRRAMASVDFAGAAAAALAVGGAELLDHRTSARRGEMVVTFRLNDRRFECTCDRETLRIIDSGICLTSHETGTRYDTLFTLESLPGVILEAERTRKLVVYRHVDGGPNHYDDMDDHEDD